MIRCKEEIRHRFDRAAITYDRYADVQQESAQVLGGILKGEHPRALLELGCGTGGFTRMLANLFPESRLTCLDFSEAMVAQAQLKGNKSITFKCIDCEEYLVDNTQSFDCVCSNATFQWFQEPRLVLDNIQRSLSAGGLFVASIFGPACLAELGEGLQAVMGDEYVLPSPKFLGKKQLHTLCHGFAQIEIYEKTYSRSYETIYDLLRVIKYTGTGGSHAVIPRFSKANLQGLSDWFMARGGITVGYQIFFIKAVKGK